MRLVCRDLPLRSADAIRTWDSRELGSNRDDFAAAW